MGRQPYAHKILNILLQLRINRYVPGRHDKCFNYFGADLVGNTTDFIYANLRNGRFRTLGS